MRLILAPPRNRPIVERLTNLPGTGCGNYSPTAMEFEACRLPIEPQKREYPAALTFEVSDQRLILDIQHPQWQHFAPMGDKALSFQISLCAITQVVGKDELACRKLLKIAGQTSIA